MNEQNIKVITLLTRKIEIGLTIYGMLYFAAIDVPDQYVKLDQILSLIVYGFVCFVTVTGWKRIVYAATKDPLLTIFIAIACLSVMWSANPSATWDQTKFLLRATFFGIYLATRYSLKELIQLLAWTMGIAMFFSFLAGVLFPGYSTHLGGSWKGAFAHKQSLGAMMGFAASIFLSQFLSGRLLQKRNALVAYGLAFVLVILSKSQTGLLIFLLSLVTLPLYKITQQRKHRGLIMVSTLLIFCAVAAVLLFNLETVVVSGFGKDIAFNGRLPVWLIAIAKGLERPWFGYGFYGFWSSDVSDVVIQNVPWVYNDATFRTREILFHSHNGFIELFLQLGVFGMVWYGMSFSLCLKKIIELTLVTRSAESFWMFQFMGIMLIGNLSEAWGVLTPSLFWVLYVALSFSSAIQYDRMQREGHDRIFYRQAMPSVS
jgi:exopolysaccharide production protein ExoQ